jgi:hypothetical protein
MTHVAEMPLTPRARDRLLCPILTFKMRPFTQATYIQQLLNTQFKQNLNFWV